eukprot:CAMPEP_0174267950 /NCGR_PEP_ID=MMETSP0439-20130205/35536_1 /TAXON_ID=0 /ORGANISM="Stereomyxa ramosa, Strain Chinc5" /LENGTH=100 /DNA_ID=CAMNT_0015355791 /DNA_START=189 /DNA_END=488 /DNA_ORIENTATION=+
MQKVEIQVENPNKCEGDIASKQVCPPQIRPLLNEKRDLKGCPKRKRCSGKVSPPAAKKARILECKKNNRNRKRRKLDGEKRIALLDLPIDIILLIIQHLE